MPRTTQNSLRRAQVSVLDVALGLSVNIAPQIQIDHPSVTAVTTATSNSTVSRLLELPSELRNRICELAVMVVTANGELSELDIKRYQLKSVKLRIAWTNKQLHDEILPVFYGMHLFRFTAHHFGSDDGHIQSGMLLLGPRSREKGENSAKPVPESSLIRFGVFGRVISKGQEGDVIELPTFSLRKLFKRVELVLRAPSMYEDGLNTYERLRLRSSSPRYTDPTRDWLYPLQNLRELGFSKLSELSVIIRYPGDLMGRNYLTNEQEIEPRFEKWVAEKMKIMKLNAEVVKVKYELDKCRLYG
ncbi:hypothetical protein LTR97_012165 [Elasticomyces elasticus]|uniref:F-box domain-containing protein n=1 Tax=Elasticomyces elasticus TaxID=574655 RepID=A0AAN7VXK8_9PEZI|nr:hypothetical protein LTR97_012165 [Elasticomyces elasticus]